MIIRVDDLIISSSDVNALKAVKMLTAKFKMKASGKLKLISILCDKCVKMSQKRYVQKKLERVLTCKIVNLEQHFKMV